MLFVFGATAAFLRHDPHPDYEAAWQQQERARRRMTRLRGRYDRVAARQEPGVRRATHSLDQLLRETEAKHDELRRAGGAGGPFLQETTARIANTVRNRSLAFLEGAIAAIKGPMTGSLAEVQAMTEAEIRRIADLASAGLRLLRRSRR